MTVRIALMAAGLVGSLLLAAPASAVPAGPGGLAPDQAGITQVRMTRSERMMMRNRMTRRDMMHKRMMRRRMTRHRMMHRM